MTVEVLIPMVGHSFTRKRGDRVELHEHEATRLIAAGYAKPVRDPKREQATRRPALEKATRQ